MTNTSNYGPVRRLSPPVSADNRKPYSRSGLKGVLGTLDLNSGDAVVPPTLDSPYYPFHVETPQLEAPTQRRITVPDGPRDITGFPTYDQYQRIEEEYLSSLSERKQPKALISQSLFDKIYAVLQNGSEDRASTAQFRFWVRKMFVLAYPQTSFNHNTTSTSQSSDPVVLHDRRPVAIKERIYEVLCYCHAVARHGGRDKTCATLRLNYSWVPKELTAKFVKACPTCTLKRSGNPDLLSQLHTAPPSYLPTAAVAAAPVPEPAPLLNGGPNDSSPGLSFPGSSDNNASSASASAASFTSSSIFTTPDLSFYPSPTLSTGSGGPMTPSSYLHGGLFGYPAVFDPGHSTLSVATWDPPCVQTYGTDDPQSNSADDTEAAQYPSLNLRLPSPRDVVRYVEGCGGNIDPALFTEGFPTPTNTNTNMGTAFGGVQGFHMLLHLPPPSTAAASPDGGIVYAPVPVGVGRMQGVLCAMQEMDAEAEVEVEIEEAEVEVEVAGRGLGGERWESPEAWLVPSDSAEEADALGD